MNAPLLAIRVKDGLFVGNVTASQDDDFLFLNKVTHIINCAATEAPNLYQHAGIFYLTLAWADNDTTLLFDPEDRVAAQIYHFIEKALMKGECVLVHSIVGNCRCCIVVVAYFMLKFGWALDNALAFMQAVHPDMSIKPHFLKQLKTYAQRHQLDMDIFSSGVDVVRLALDNEQWVLKNTFLNSLGYQHPQQSHLRRVVLEYETQRKPSKSSKRVAYVDTKQAPNVTAQTLPVASAPHLSSGPILKKTCGPNPHPLVTEPGEIPAVLLAQKQNFVQPPRPPPRQETPPVERPPVATTHTILTHKPTRSAAPASPFVLSSVAGRKGSPLPARDDKPQAPLTPAQRAGLIASLQPTQSPQRTLSPNGRVTSYEGQAARLRVATPPALSGIPRKSSPIQQRDDRLSGGGGQRSDAPDARGANRTEAVPRLHLPSSNYGAAPPAHATISPREHTNPTPRAGIGSPFRAPPHSFPPQQSLSPRQLPVHITPSPPRTGYSAPGNTRRSSPVRPQGTDGVLSDEEESPSGRRAIRGGSNKSSTLMQPTASYLGKVRP